MPHLSGRCTCGRPIHFPKGAQDGDEWRCFRCHRVWVLCPNGELPLNTTKSQPPPERPATVPAALPAAAPARPPRPVYRPYHRPRQAARPGCSLVLLVGLIIPVVWWLV